LRNDKTIKAYHFGQYYCLFQKECRLPKIEIDWLIKVLSNGCFFNGPVICPRIVKEGCIGPRQFLKLLNTHFKSVENITDDRFVPYITGCVVNFNINMK
jgi:hypothetical protein